jgi:hypothetical protein
LNDTSPFSASSAKSGEVDHDLANLVLPAYRLSKARETRMHGDVEMNAGHFEQSSDCWLLEEQPATYYRSAAARARMLQAMRPRLE